MTGYDFDKTIYKGDSSTDFFFFIILRRPYLLIFTLWFLIVLALYGMKILNKKRRTITVRLKNDYCYT